MAIPRPFKEDHQELPLPMPLRRLEKLKCENYIVTVIDNNCFGKSTGHILSATTKADVLQGHAEC